VLSRALALAWLFVVCAPSPRARAELSGAVDGRALIGIDQRYGGALLAELWGSRGMVRPGVAFGLAALSGNGEASSRVVTPLGFSLAIVPRNEASGFLAIVRLGGYAGAEKGGFIGGAFGSGALGYGISLGEGASVRLTVDVWGLIGTRGGLFLGPALGFGF
jgi:hypothetical protein